MGKTWRERAAPIITDAIKRVGVEDMKALRKELRTVYPFGARRWFPYKAWCSECRNQIAAQFPKPDKGVDGLELFENVKEKLNEIT